MNDKKVKVAAIAAGIAWLALSLTAVDSLRQSRSH
jgi:ABC-type transport system involved in cytochrome c biogenesis permease component